MVDHKYLPCLLASKGLQKAYTRTPICALVLMHMHMTAETLTTTTETRRFRSDATTDACLRQPYFPKSRRTNYITITQRYHRFSICASLPCTAPTFTLLIRVTQHQIVRSSASGKSTLAESGAQQLHDQTQSAPPPIHTEPFTIPVR